ncbi:pirin family protein [Gordonia sp. CPCC 205333]|uniref:pirin family protein n=1 Tax=Gordonia sp. CPCC 205333 TaxID=3140790 RepID=UPI003AF3BDCF
MTYTVHYSSDRATTTTEWLRSRHSFSFGDHYDPANTHHGMLLAVNEETVAAQQGFDTHPHRETEIVTWVLDGSLVHQDSAGHSGVIYPGLAQRMSAGTGVEHSERNDTWSSRPDSGHTPVRFVQMWLMPDEYGLAPSYGQSDVDGDLADGELIAVASGSPSIDSAIRVANRNATMYAARPTTGQQIVIPPTRFTMALVTRGSVVFDAGPLGAGDAIRGTDLGGEPITAVSDAEILIWSMNRALGEQ